MILAGFTWGCSIRDLVTIAACFGTPLAAMIPRPKKHDKTTAVDDTTDAAETPYVGVLSEETYGGAADVKTGGGTPPPDKTLAILAAALPRHLQGSGPALARLLIADDFIEAMLVVQHVMATIDANEGDVARSLEYVEALGLDAARVLGVLGRREEIIEDLLVAGFDIYTGGGALRDADAADFMGRVCGLKRAIYDGLRGRLLRYDAAENGYFSCTDSARTAVTVPPLCSDAFARSLGIADFAKPAFIVTDALLFVSASRDTPRPLLYKVAAGLVSVMDGYVDIDVATPS